MLKTLALAALLSAASPTKLPEQHELPKTESLKMACEAQEERSGAGAAGGIMAGLAKLGPVGWSLLIVGGTVAVVATGEAARIAAGVGAFEEEKANLAAREKEAAQKAKAHSSRIKNSHASHGRGKNGR